MLLLSGETDALDFNERVSRTHTHNIRSRNMHTFSEIRHNKKKEGLNVLQSYDWWLFATIDEND